MSTNSCTFAVATLKIIDSSFSHSSRLLALMNHNLKNIGVVKGGHAARE